ncbi:hypothetical protein ACQRIT_006774 [Beauveria bassiana]
MNSRYKQGLRDHSTIAMTNTNSADVKRPHPRTPTQGHRSSPGHWLSFNFSSDKNRGLAASWYQAEKLGMVPKPVDAV